MTCPYSSYFILRKMSDIEILLDFQRLSKVPLSRLAIFILSNYFLDIIEKLINFLYF